MDIESTNKSSNNITTLPRACTFNDRDTNAGSSSDNSDSGRNHKGSNIPALSRARTFNSKDTDKGSNSSDDSNSSTNADSSRTNSIPPQPRGEHAQQQGHRHREQL